MSEKPDRETTWEEEAKAVIKDVTEHVHSITISNLPSSKRKFFFNMTTLEKKDFCVELSEEGFRVVGEKYDSEEKKGKYPVFETPYSMLDNLSPAYRDSFGERLLEKLNQLQNKRMEEENAHEEEQPNREREKRQEEQKEDEDVPKD